MNSAMPWVKFSPCDWIVGTLGLMPEQKGVYIDLLMLMYERKAPVKFDIAFLSRAFGCSQNKLRKIIDELVRLEKIIITQAGIWNARVEKMLAGFEDDKERHEDLSEKRRKAGLASVQAKSIKKQHVSEGVPTNAQQNFNKRSTNAQQNSTHVDHIEEDKEEDIDIKNICSNEQIQKKSLDDGQPINSAMALETTDSISKSPAKPPEPSQAQLQKSALEEEFEGIFWGEYGHNVNKKKAREAFIKARKKYDLKVIMDGVRRYKNSREYHEFRMHAATFLNNARWSDDFTPLGTNSSAMGSYPTPKPSSNRHVAGASILANIETSKRVMPRLQEIRERLLADANH